MMAERHFSPAVSLARNRKELIELAGISEQAERYRDMAECMKAVVQMGWELSLEERNLFSVAYKNLIGGKRSAWRVLSAIEQKVDGLSNQLARQYQERVATEIKAVCSEALELVEKHLEPHARQAEHKLFYAKMTGDYYRYLAEITPSCDEQQKLYSDASRAAYDRAVSLSRTGLPTTHPIRLGLALSFAVFSYEILNDHERAVQIAKAAFDEAISDLDNLSDSNYKDTTLIMQLLRDNLMQWTASNKDATTDGP